MNRNPTRVNRPDYLRPDDERAATVERLQAVRQMGARSLVKWCDARVHEPLRHDWEIERMAKLMEILGPGPVRVIRGRANRRRAK